MGLSRSFSVLGFSLSMLICAAGSLSARAQMADCSGNGPLIAARTAPIDPGQAPTTLGEWRLPISFATPGNVTEARVRLRLQHAADGGGSVVSVQFSFPDPQPWGLPFTFERAELSWESHGQRYTVALDWTQGCNEPGRSLFPGQSWSAPLDLGFEGQNTTIDRPVFRLFGSRN